MLSDVAFFVLKVSEMWTLELLIEYMHTEGVPKGILNCDAVGIAARKEGQWGVILLREDLHGTFFDRRDFSLSNILSDNRLQQVCRIAFVVWEDDFEEFSAVANAKSICGQYCVFADARLPTSKDLRG